MMPPKGRGKRKIEEVICDDNGGYARPHDKVKLLQALKDHGPSVIYDYDKLKDYLPSKSLTEIKFLISSYEKKGKELCAKENAIDSYPEMKNIAEWSSIISYCVPFPAKKDDLSLMLKDIFAELGKQFPSSSSSQNDTNKEESDVDYRAIHSYFHSILAGKHPMDLADREASVVLSIMDNLVETIDSLGNGLENEFLAAQSWWKPSSTNGSQNDESESSEQPSSTSQNINSNGQDSANPDDPEYYEDLPRIRKIRECLNPLKVPREILDANHDLVTSSLI